MKRYSKLVYDYGLSDIDNEIWWEMHNQGPGWMLIGLPLRLMEIYWYQEVWLGRGWYPGQEYHEAFDCNQFPGGTLDGVNNLSMEDERFFMPYEEI